MRSDIISVGCGIDFIIGTWMMLTDAHNLTGYFGVQHPIDLALYRQGTFIPRCYASHRE